MCSLTKHFTNCTTLDVDLQSASRQVLSHFHERVAEIFPRNKYIKSASGKVVSGFDKRCVTESKSL